jgi:hypothetical protein
MRKKQRHEELLHSEEQLVKMNRMEELTNKRCQSIFRFLSLRGYMLMQVKDSVKMPTTTTTLPKITASGESSSSCPSEIQQLESYRKEVANTVACSSLLAEVVNNMDDFVFECCSLGLTVDSKEVGTTVVREACCFFL